MSFVNSIVFIEHEIRKGWVPLTDLGDKHMLLLVLLSCGYTAT